MPIPTKSKDESIQDFIERCMIDDIMKNEYTDEKQRYAVCVNQLGWKISKDGK
jgi:dihydroxyacetone kinase